jgi:hypothetical protein
MALQAVLWDPLDVPLNCFRDSFTWSKADPVETEPSPSVHFDGKDMWVARYSFEAWHKDFINILGLK